jgi:hypothetical protein
MIRGRRSKLFDAAAGARRIAMVERITENDQDNRKHAKLFKANLFFTQGSDTER